MLYWIGYKVSPKALLIYVEPFSKHEAAQKHYKLMEKNLLPGEILIPPFLAEAEGKAREKARQLIPE